MNYADGIPVHCAFTELADVMILVPNPRNPNQHPQKQIEMLAKIIKNQGWRAPITVSSRSGFVVRGHGRLLAAQLLGVGQVPVDRQNYATEAEEWADLVADNRIAELSQIDDALLAELVTDISAGDFDIGLTGYNDKQLDNLLADFRAPVKEDDFDTAAAAAAIKEPVTKSGDIWQLGRHRLMCGDATVMADVEKLMDGRKAAMVFTDPPYNVAYEGATAEKLTIRNDDMPTEQFNEFLKVAFTSMLEAVDAGGAIYVCHADSEGSNFRGALQDAGWLLKQCLIWVKNQFVLGRQDYQWRHEPILYGWKPGGAHCWYGGRKQGTVIDEAAPITVRQEGNGALLTFTAGVQTVTIRVPSYEVLQAGDDSMTSVWRFEKPLRNGEHPTMKPIGLCARAIQNSSRLGEITADFFGGAGSTLMAAEQTDRVCYMMEIDPVYCDVIIRRWEEFSQQKAICL
ncbi:ParB N-terminal domain-containing protein|uniref:DNA modification methylase n=1 Tax=Dendrosporobacter quercicolus TaxID=146817 RepID=A0A1G9ZTK8_9FIRM|nr:site-specific DNA-methyltransferase [Dendrosporobacter quercicolus]NSL49588.1 ParB N-terminal domain-containing protein [Dendrosporobacter quercicolus DSM 1736]SDN23866.1 DNA modification methylase [Dendrosporobacter quercicolus]